MRIHPSSVCYAFSISSFPLVSLGVHYLALPWLTPVGYSLVEASVLANFLALRRAKV